MGVTHLNFLLLKPNYIPLLKIILLDMSLSYPIIEIKNRHSEERGLFQNEGEKG